jgi:hypothetical protein
MTAPLQLMLDQNVPGPPQGLRFDLVDKTVTIQHFSSAFPEDAKVTTPDWKVYLLAKRDGFDGVITSDHHHLRKSTEMAALTITRLGLITWKAGQDDAVVLYGQLLAYMPQIAAELRLHKGAIFRLPTAYLRSNDHFISPRGVLGEMQQRDKVSYPERRSEALRLMRSSLENDGADASLLSLLPEA